MDFGKSAAFYGGTYGKMLGRVISDVAWIWSNRIARLGYGCYRLQVVLRDPIGGCLWIVRYLY